MVLKEVKRGSVMKRREWSERRNISPKRQVTIPQVFYEGLGFEKEVEFVRRGNELILRPVRDDMDFSKEILKDLVAQGLSGQELINEFEAVKSKIRPAVEMMLEDAKTVAKKRKGTGDTKTQELFGDND
ncbi:MAG: AbrB/MazE/SpoVT family DNA-binding domain-containing protein [Dethiobacter sp.]|jgi:bifunctional DNA-binding transcriptional regulator/antitoxin component of YhaV-PrlF toxin-antitoxin module|nr:AbrB/MazE/SpoVT family DNA-binding domain-containing protein [Dethiobacter sp.]